MKPKTNAYFAEVSLIFISKITQKVLIKFDTVN
jgi:hypothetical protein